MLAVVPDDEIATLRLGYVARVQAARHEPAHVAGGAEAHAADARQIAGVGEDAEDQARAVEHSWALGAEDVVGTRGTRARRR